MEKLQLHVRRGRIGRGVCAAGAIPGVGSPSRKAKGTSLTGVRAPGASSNLGAGASRNQGKSSLLGRRAAAFTKLTLLFS